MRERIQAAELVLPCADLDSCLEFFLQKLGFKVETIFPADDPAVAVIAGFGVRLRLQRGQPGNQDLLPTLRLRCERAALADGPTHLTAPNGMQIELVDADPPVALPPVDQSLVLTRMGKDAQWGLGRAGMQYRDLIPGRQGGRFIASHIRIPDGGPVPDYVHFHSLRLQMVFCYKGWVRVVYEDQGESFVMKAGDCVLQPPRIRHRVLEASPGLEVIELACPAEHLTGVDHDLELPTKSLRPDRDFGGQRFVRHEAAKVGFKPSQRPGFEARDTGIAVATDGLAGVRVLRPVGAGMDTQASHAGEFLFLFVLAGAVTLMGDGLEPEALAAGDSLVVPAGLAYRFLQPSGELELLEVTLPAFLP